MILCWPHRIRHCSYDGTKYRLTPDAPDCYVKQGGTNIGYFQTMTLLHNQLHIDHFAVDGSQIGKRKAEILLRSFAALVKKQAPRVARISFDLGRATSNSDVVKLSQARVALFRRIGASDIQVREPNKHCKVVTATWDKNEW